MAVKVLRILGKRGRTTVPYPLRKELGFQPGDVVSFTLENDCVAVRKETICDLDSCPLLEEDSGEISAETVLEDFACLTPNGQYQVLSALMANLANRINNK